MSHSICVSCGQKAYSPPCQSSPHCINCDGPHGSNSRDCPKFQMERKVQKIRATDKLSFSEPRHRYQVDFSRSFVSVFKSPSSTTSSSKTMRPPRHSVHCQVTLTSLIGYQDNHPQLLKIITPTVQPTTSLKVQNLVLLLHCLLQISRPPLVHLIGPLVGQPLHLPNLLATDHIPHRDPLLGTP